MHRQAERLGLVALQHPYELRLPGQVGDTYRPAFGDSCLQRVEADGFAEMSHAQLVACGESQGWRKEPAEGGDAMAAGWEGWAVGVRSLSLQNQPGGGDVLWREEEGKS